MTSARRSVMWFRRDLRLADNPALLTAIGDGAVLPLFVLDPRLPDAGPRVDRLLASLRELDRTLDGALVVRGGRPDEVVPTVAAEVGAARVHVSAESTPFGRRRDAAVAEALRGLGGELVATGCPYAVAPGRVVNGSGGGYAVFTPFARAWNAHGWPAPAPAPVGASWLRGPGIELVAGRRATEAAGHEAGEAAASTRWRAFLGEGLAEYAESRDRPDLDGTSRMSIPLKYGEIHPRTLLADLTDRGDPNVDKLVSELAWREFYADVLWRHPRSAWTDLRPTLAADEYDDPGDAAELVDAWRAGRTGYPIVDAGMRQLLGEGWMHNRVRMITASFLVKDLHIWWPTGARHFLRHLLDGDIASNNHGWQWVAGTGTDAAPYFRVFNPVLQGERFDPRGDYVRRWVPELRHLTGSEVHQPWRQPDGYAHGYPERIVDHAAERREALARLARSKG